MRQRAVSVLEVAEPGLWAELEAALGCPLDQLFEPAAPDGSRVALPEFELRLSELRGRGLAVLVRYARRSHAQAVSARADLSRVVADLPDPARKILYRAQRHAFCGEVMGAQVWDPVGEAQWVDALFAAGLVEPTGTLAPARQGYYRLHADLPDPPPVAYAFAEAAMPPTDDLSPPGPAPVGLLYDLAALSAALERSPPRRTHSGTLDKATAKRLGSRLGVPQLAREGALPARWDRALRALEAMALVGLDPVSRQLQVEPGLELTLEGTAGQALDRFVRRLIERDLQAALPPVRTALAQCLEGADGGAVDELIFLELLCEQDRGVLFAPWGLGGRPVYPGGDAARAIPYLPESFEHIEGRMLDRLLRALTHVGLVRRAPGVFAPTEDGRLWATGEDPPAPPIWVGADMEVLVPPSSVTPWERYQLERLGQCLARDVVDRYRLDRAGLEAWLARHPLEDALGLLSRRSPGLPASVRDTLQGWARGAQRFVLTRGVLLPAL